ncbi:MAG TPA: FmdB family zinc ribbon protein [Chthoniobacteraceae bacterium]|nr:FmdB family zinc ribbon protein [Chthoniobacteraceae bacterium]
MPTYDYQCEKCDRTFEVFQSMKDPHLTQCTQPGCDGKVRRLLGTGAGLIFKGSGFYITDYRSDQYKQAAKKDAPSASSGSSSSGSSSPGASTGSGSSSAPAPTSTPTAKP